MNSKSAVLSNGRLTSWSMLLDVPPEFVTNQGHSLDPSVTPAVGKFVQDLGDQLSNFLHEEKTTLPVALDWPASVSRQ